jgi:hypothetical protein
VGLVGVEVQVDQPAPEQLGLGEAQQLTGRAVGAADHAGGVDHQHAVGQRRHQRARQRSVDRDHAPIVARTAARRNRGRGVAG